MSPNLKFSILAWILFSVFIYFAQSSPESGKKIPYDVLLPPDGDGESLPPIIMLHGALDWRKTWKKLAPEIAKNTGRKVYAYDAINSGENAWSDEFHMDMLVSELDHFMEDHTISKAILVGHSMGGKTAMMFATQKPERVEKLILEDISPTKLSPKLISLMKGLYLTAKIFVTELEHEDDELAAKELILRFMQRIFRKDQMKNLGEDFLMEWMPITKRDEKIGFRGNLDLYISLLNTKTLDEIDPGVDGVYHGNVLFLYGTKSPFNVSADELIPKHFPHSTLVKFEGGTHNLHFEFVKEFEHAVSDFINKEPSTE